MPHWSSVVEAGGKRAVYSIETDITAEALPLGCIGRLRLFDEVQIIAFVYDRNMSGSLWNA